MRAHAVHIEVVEKADIPFDPDVPGSGVMRVSEVRLNGVPLLVPAEEGITVHEVSTTGDRPVKVTLTLFARLIEYKREPRAQDGSS